MRVDPGLVVAIAGVVATQRHAHGPVAIADDTELATETRILSVRRDEVAPANLADCARLLVLHVDAGGTYELAVATRGRFDEVDRLDAVHDVGAMLRRIFCDESVEVESCDRVAVVRELRVLGPVHLEGRTKPEGP